MKAMILNGVTPIEHNENPLEMADIPVVEPASGEVRLRVKACGVCHTELDEIEGRTPPPRFPIIPGHEVVGVIDAVGPGVDARKMGQRVGVGWIYSSCGQCAFCKERRDNLCESFKATGRDVNGGYAEAMVVPEGWAFPIPNSFTDLEAAPLFCAGAIGYRSLNLTGLNDGQRLGLTGFGASAHLVLKMARYVYPHSEIYVFARNERERHFALELGASWAGDTADTSPYRLHAIIDTTPVWKPVVEALRNLESGGRLVINAIRKENVDQDNLLNLDYSEHLWMEKEIKSVANVSRNDISGLLELADEISLKPEVEVYPLEQANRALVELKKGRIRGAKVLGIS